ncbi:hypothetical protein Bca4012_016343 [Brassica carinata]
MLGHHFGLKAVEERPGPPGEAIETPVVYICPRNRINLSLEHFTTHASIVTADKEAVAVCSAESVNLKVDKDYPILVFGGGYLHAVSALDGEVLWKKDFTAEGFEVRRVLQPPGSSSIIYVLGFLHSSEAIVCIRLIPKVERWWHRKARDISFQKTPIEDSGNAICLLLKSINNNSRNEDEELRSGRTKLTRDHNGFRKLFIALTRAGKLFALETLEIGELSGPSSSRHGRESLCSCSWQMLDALIVFPGSVTPEESALVVYLIDTITGRTLHRLTHQGCQGPVHALFSESWVVNDYFNLRANKYEVTVVEIYDQSRAENKNVWKLVLGQHNLTAPISSYSRSEVLTKSQSYFFPQTIAVTSTAKGITSKQLLIGTIGDQILALDKRFVNPRRTLNPSQAEKESSLSRIHYPSFLRFTHTHVIRHTLPQGRRSKKHSNSSGQARVNNTRLCLWSGSLLHKDLLLQRPTIRSPMISATHFS